jgi:hypothetical protein
MVMGYETVHIFILVCEYLIFSTIYLILLSGTSWLCFKV